MLTDETVSKFFAFEHLAGVGSGMRSYFFGARNYVLQNHGVISGKFNSEHFPVSLTLLESYSKFQNLPEAARARKVDREPITVADILSVESIILANTTDWDPLTFLAMLKAAAYGAVRIGEIAWKPKITKPVLIEQLEFLPKGCTIETCKYAVLNLESDKTDKISGVVQIVLPRTKSPSDPVIAIWKSLEARRLSTGLEKSMPLFLWKNKPVTYNMFREWLRILCVRVGWDPETHLPHSLRIGAATTAARLHLPSYFVKAIGRWHSPSFLRYIQLSLDQKADLASKLVAGENGNEDTVIEDEYFSSLHDDS
jgi:hypothetical protein